MATIMEYNLHPELYSCGIDHVLLPPKRQIGQHVQETWELAYVLKGSGVRTIGNTVESFDEGELLLIPPKIPHGWVFDPRQVDSNGNIENIAVVFSNPILRQCAATFPELRESVENILSFKDAILIEGERRIEITLLLKRMADDPETSHPLHLIHLLMLLGGEKGGKVVGRHQVFSRADLRMNQLRTYLTCNFNRDIRLDDAAAHLGMNRSAFCVFLKKTIGKTFTEYLNGYRICKACETLQSHPDMPISEVAYQMGFNTICYFNRIFLKHTGMSPNAYRKLKKKT